MMDISIALFHEEIIGVFNQYGRGDVYKWFGKNVQHSLRTQKSGMIFPVATFTYCNMMSLAVDMYIYLSNASLGEVNVTCTDPQELPSVIIFQPLPLAFPQRYIYIHFYSRLLPHGTNLSQCTRKWV